MNFNKNKLIDKTLKTFYKTYYSTIDTGDFVTAKTNQKIYRYIDKNLKNAFQLIDKEVKKYQKRSKRIEKEKDKILKYQNKQEVLKLKRSLKSMKKSALTKHIVKQQYNLFVKLRNYLRYQRLKRKHLLLTYTKPE